MWIFILFSDQNAKIIVQLLNEILLQQKQNTQLLQALLRKDPVGDALGDGEIRQASLPLDSYEDLQVLEENMERKDFRKALVTFLIKINNIYLAQVVILTFSVWHNLNFCGRVGIAIWLVYSYH